MQTATALPAITTQPTLFDDEQSVYKQFLAFHAKYPKVYDLYKAFCFQLINKDYTKIGSKMIIERIRWEIATGSKDDAGFKINNNYTAHYARLFAQEYPQYKDYFEFREIKRL